MERVKLSFLSAEDNLRWRNDTIIQPWYQSSGTRKKGHTISFSVKQCVISGIQFSDFGNIIILHHITTQNLNLNYGSVNVSLQVINMGHRCICTLKHKSCNCKTPGEIFLCWASVPGQVEEGNQWLVIIQPRFLSDFLQWLLKWQVLQNFYLKNLSSSLSFPVCSTLVDMVDMVWDFLISQPIFYPGVPTYHDKDTRISLQKLLSFRYKKKYHRRWR